MRSRPAAPPAPERTASVADFNDSPFVALLKRENQRVAQTSSSIPGEIKMFNSCDEMIKFIETEAAESAKKMYPNAVETGVKTEYDSEYYRTIVEMAIEYYIDMDSAQQECKETLDDKIESAHEELNKLNAPTSMRYLDWRRFWKTKVEEVLG